MEQQAQTLNRLWKRVQDCRDDAEGYAQSGHHLAALYYHQIEQETLAEIRRICHAALQTLPSIG